MNSLRQVAFYVHDPFLSRLYQRRVKANSVVVWFDSLTALKAAVSCYDLVVADLTEEASPTLQMRELVRATHGKKLIVMAETKDPELVVEAFRLGVTDFLLKPVNPETVSWAMGRAYGPGNFESSGMEISDIFRVAHEMRLADDSSSMYSVAGKKIADLTQAQSHTWASLTEHEDDVFEQFRADNPKLFTDGIESERIGHPERWFLNSEAWIPLKESWMGGLFLKGVPPPTNDTLARVEYLIRNLEYALENFVRYNEAKRLSYVDDLTLAYNSRYLNLFASECVEDQKNFAVLFIDVDRFKCVNDTHGHGVGSGLLVQLAKALKHGLRDSDVLFRYGGDEFVVILDSTPRTEAMEIAERLRSSIEINRFQVSGHEVRVTVSIGVALFPDDGQSKKAVLDLADEAMYVAKSSRNTVYSSRT